VTLASVMPCHATPLASWEAVILLSPVVWRQVRSSELLNVFPRGSAEFRPMTSNITSVADCIRCIPVGVDVMKYLCLGS
jgi:hypothetical protein